MGSLGKHRSRHQDRRLQRFQLSEDGSLKTRKGKLHHQRIERTVHRRNYHQHCCREFHNQNRREGIQMDWWVAREMIYVVV